MELENDGFILLRVEHVNPIHPSCGRVSGRGVPTLLLRSKQAFSRKERANEQLGFSSLGRGLQSQSAEKLLAAFER
jgi:hypothetical protein